METKKSHRIKTNQISVKELFRLVVEQFNKNKQSKNENKNKRVKKSGHLNSKGLSRNKK